MYRLSQAIRPLAWRLISWSNREARKHNRQTVVDWELHAIRALWMVDATIAAWLVVVVL